MVGNTENIVEILWEKYSNMVFFGCEDAAQQVLMSVLVNQSQAIQSNANEFRLCAFLDFVSKSKLEGYIVMEGTFRLCAFLFCVSKSKP